MAWGLETNIKGPGGPVGPIGPQGSNAFTLSAASFTVPPVNSTVAVAVLDAAWVAVGQMVWVENAGGPGIAGAFLVTAKAGNVLTLLNPPSSSGGGGGAMTGAQILTALAPVDGAGSGLDADLLDGNSSAFFATATALAGKEPTITGGTTAQYYRGDKSWQTLDKTAVGLNNVANTAQVTSVTGTAPVVSSGGTTPAISMAAATTSVNGYLTSTDWNTFNGKATTAAVALKADLAGPTFTGVPAAPTAAVATNTTQIATTAYVKSQGYQKITVGTTAPGSPAVNELWVDTN